LLETLGWMMHDGLFWPMISWWQRPAKQKLLPSAST